jgi:hypothetical protein
MTKVIDDAFDSVHVTSTWDKFIVLSIGGELKPAKKLESVEAFRDMRRHRRYVDQVHRSKNRHAVLSSSRPAPLLGLYCLKRHV